MDLIDIMKRDDALRQLDPIDIIDKKLIIRHYDGLATRISEFAWNSFVNWWKNPVWSGFYNRRLKDKMFADLLKSRYFLPVSDKNLVMRIFRDLTMQKKGDHFMMIRLSQNERPLVWVLASGGTGKIVRVRIGVELISATKTSETVVKYSVILDKKVFYQSTDLRKVIEALRNHYLLPQDIYSWHRATRWQKWISWEKRRI